MWRQVPHRFVEKASGNDMGATFYRQKRKILRRMAVFGMMTEYEKKSLALVLEFEAQSKNASWYVDGEKTADGFYVVESLLSFKQVLLIPNH